MEGRAIRIMFTYLTVYTYTHMYTFGIGCLMVSYLCVHTCMLMSVLQIVHLTAYIYTVSVINSLTSDHLYACSAGSYGNWHKPLLGIACMGGESPQLCDKWIHLNIAQKSSIYRSNVSVKNYIFTHDSRYRHVSRRRDSRTSPALGQVSRASSRDEQSLITIHPIQYIIISSIKHTCQIR